MILVARLLEGTTWVSAVEWAKSDSELTLLLDFCICDSVAMDSSKSKWIKQSQAYVHQHSFFGVESSDPFQEKARYRSCDVVIVATVFSNFSSTSNSTSNFSSEKGFRSTEGGKAML